MKTGLEATRSSQPLILRAGHERATLGKEGFVAEAELFATYVFSARLASAQKRYIGAPSVHPENAEINERESLSILVCGLVVKKC